MIGIAPCISVTFAAAIIALGVSFSTSAVLQCMPNTHRTNFMIKTNMFAYLPHFAEQLTNWNPPQMENSGGTSSSSSSSSSSSEYADGTLDNIATAPFEKCPFPSIDLLLASAILLTCVVAVMFVFLWCFQRREQQRTPPTRAWRPPSSSLLVDEQQQQGSEQSQYQPGAAITATVATMQQQQPQETTTSSSSSHHEVFQHPSLFRLSPDTPLRSIRQVSTAMRLFENNDNNNNNNIDAGLKACGWTYQSTKNDIQYWSKPSPYSSVVATLFYVFIPNVSAQDVQLVNDELDCHYKFDTLLVKRTLIRRGNDGREWWRNETKQLVWGVKPRDVVTERVGLFLSQEDIERELSPLKGIVSVGGRGGGGKKQEEQHPPRAFAIFADNFGDQYPEDPKYQRGKMCTSMLMACEQQQNGGEDGVLYVALANVDPSGSVPSAVVNMGLSAGMERVRLQRELFIEESRTRRIYNKYYGGRNRR